MTTRVKFAWNFILINIFLANACYAENSFYNDRERGWYYHEKLEREKPAKKDLLQRQPLSEMSPDEVLGLLASVQKEIQVRQARFTLEPNVENARDFLEYQQLMFKHGHQASESMQTALIKYPYLDPRIDNPISQQAIKVKAKQDDKINDLKIQEFAQNFRLIYFFKAGCPYCEEFKPVIERLVKNFNFAAEAIGSDSRKLDVELITTIPDNGLVAKLNITTFPSLFAYSEKYNIYLPISRGFLPYQDLKSNVLHVYEHIVNLAMEETE